MARPLCVFVLYFMYLITLILIEMFTLFTWRHCADAGKILRNYSMSIYQRSLVRDVL